MAKHSIEKISYVAVPLGIFGGLGLLALAIVVSPHLYATYWAKNNLAPNAVKISNNSRSDLSNKDLDGEGKLESLLTLHAEGLEGNYKLEKHDDKLTLTPYQQ